MKITVFLADEAEYLHKSIFRESPDLRTIKRYESANAKIFPSGHVSPLVCRIISHRLDVGAIEYALRRRRLGMELTTKLQIVVYLAEARGRYQGEFVNMKRCRVKAFASLAAALVCTAWSFIKGEYLIRRHGLL